MENYISVLVNTALIVSSITLALVFLVNPFPDKNALQNYRNSLRFLAIAYLAVAFLSIPYVFEGYTSNVPVDLTALSLETILFSIALIVLFNPLYINRKFLFKCIAPTLGYILLFNLFSLIWGSPEYKGIQTSDFGYFCHPTAILNGLFLLFCIAQMICFTRIFRAEAKKYLLKIENYYSETDSIKLVWVRYNFYSALAFGILIIFSIIVSSSDFSIVVTMINIVFNTVFGLSYIQYPKTYNKIEALLWGVEENAIYSVKVARKKSWSEYKTQIISEKYYLRQGVNIEDMAQHLKIGRTTLSNYINSEERVNFNTWINMLRIEEAKHLLLDSDPQSLSMIAERVGYSESSNFSRQFKLITNESPSVWKQRQRQMN